MGREPPPPPPPDKPPPVRERASRIADEVVLIKRRLGEASKGAQDAKDACKSEFLKNYGKKPQKPTPPTPPPPRAPTPPTPRPVSAAEKNLNPALQAALSGAVDPVTGMAPAPSTADLVAAASTVEELLAATAVLQGINEFNEQKRLAAVLSAPSMAEKWGTAQDSEDDDGTAPQGDETKEEAQARVAAEYREGRRAEAESGFGSLDCSQLEVAHPRSGVRPANFLSSNKLGARLIDRPTRIHAPPSLDDKNYRVKASNQRYTWRDAD